MNLSNLKPAKGSVKNKTRIARGQGSGHGGTATRGHKGQKSRSGYSKKVGFEGGQMHLQRRVPKFGFKNINRVEYKGINLDTIQALVDTKKIKNEVTSEPLEYNSKPDNWKISLNYVEKLSDILMENGKLCDKHILNNFAHWHHSKYAFHVFGETALLEL